MEAEDPEHSRSQFDKHQGVAWRHPLMCPPHRDQTNNLLRVHPPHLRGQQSSPVIYKFVRFAGLIAMAPILTPVTPAFQRGTTYRSHTVILYLMYVAYCIFFYVKRNKKFLKKMKKKVYFTLKTHFLNLKQVTRVKIVFRCLFLMYSVYFLILILTCKTPK